MIHIIHVVIFVFVDLLFLSEIICPMTFKVKPLKIGTSGTIPCDHVKNDPEVRLVQWYKSRRNDAFENVDPSLAWFKDGLRGSLPNYYMENNTFSLVIVNDSLEDEGLYKCYVESGDVFTESYYFTRTVMYALPRVDPVITVDPALNRVNCTFEHVKPLVYPVFNFDYSRASTETYAVLNEDGTYTTSVSCALPPNKSTSRVDCSFSYLHYKGVGSLDLSDTTTDILMENKTTTKSPLVPSVTSAGDGCRTVNHTAITVGGVLLSLSAVVIVILIIMLKRRQWNWGVHKCNTAKEYEEKMFQPAMETVA